MTAKKRATVKRTPARKSRPAAPSRRPAAPSRRSAAPAVQIQNNITSPPVVNVFNYISSAPALHIRNATNVADTLRTGEQSTSAVSRRICEATRQLTRYDSEGKVIHQAFENVQHFSNGDRVVENSTISNERETPTSKALGN
jgi:hypothetical protein